MSINIKSSDATPSISRDMKKLLENQVQINMWLIETEQKIYKVFIYKYIYRLYHLYLIFIHILTIQFEESYLSENPYSNIIRGWNESEGKPPLQQLRNKNVDEKDRIFSSSSHQAYDNVRTLASDILSSTNPPPKKKARRSSSGIKAEKDSVKFRKSSIEDEDEDVIILNNLDQLDNAQLELDLLDDVY